MEIITTARFTGPFGSFERKQRLTSEKLPISYLEHLVEIGVAHMVLQHRVEPELLKKKAELTLGSASPPAPVSQEKTSTKRETLTLSRSTQTTK